MRIEEKIAGITTTVFHNGAKVTISDTTSLGEMAELMKLLPPESYVKLVYVTKPEHQRYSFNTNHFPAFWECSVAILQDPKKRGGPWIDNTGVGKTIAEAIDKAYHKAVAAYVARMGSDV